LASSIEIDLKLKGAAISGSSAETIISNNHHPAEVLL
jgi:hypothetical protein